MASRLINPFRGLGLVRSLVLLAGLAAYIALGAWLHIAATWPGNCLPHGRKLERMVSSLWCSPALLGQGWIELGLFLWLWGLPIFVTVIVIYAYRNRRRAPRPN